MPPIPARSISATGCRSITIPTRCAPRPATSMRSPVNYDVDSPRRLGGALFLRRAQGAEPAPSRCWCRSGSMRARKIAAATRNNGHLMTVATQAERARGAAAAARGSPPCRRLSVSTGSSITTIPPAAAPTARTTISAWSISTTGRISAWSPRLAPPIARCRGFMPGRALPRRRRRSPCPEAHIDPAQRSLVDWPKPASLLPPLRAPTGEVRVRRGLSRLERPIPRPRRDRPGLLRSQPARL